MNRKITNFFFEKQNNYFWLIFFRISVSLFIIIHFLSVLSDFDNLYSVDNGVISYSVAEVFIPDFIINLPEIIIFFESLGVAASVVVLLFKILFLIFAFTLLIGYKQNFSAFILLFLQIFLSKSNMYYAYGVDFFTSLSLFYLAIIPRDLSSFGLSAFKRLFQIHISIAYFFAGFDKLIGVNWWNGESIWKAINLPFTTSNYDVTFLGKYPDFLMMLGIVTALLELTYPALVWYAKTRHYCIYLTILMHIGIAFILNLYFFSALMIIWNLTLKFSFNNEKSYHFYHK